MNYLSRLPNELLNEIFFTFSDEKTRITCLTLDKTISEFMMDSLFEKIQANGIPSSLTISYDKKSPHPYRQIMQYHLKYHHYFMNKVPDAFDIEKSPSLIEANTVIGQHLLKIDRLQVQFPLVDKIFSHFVDTLNPKIAKNIDFLQKIDSSFFIEPNEEIKLLVSAGAKFRLEMNLTERVISILEQEWCTPETANMVFSRALDHAWPNSFKIDFQQMKGNYNYLIEENIDQILENYLIVESDILAIIQNKISEPILLKFIEKSVSPFYNAILIRKALENDYSEDVIFKLLEKVDSKFNRSIAKLATKKNYSEKCIELLNSKTGPLFCKDDILITILLIGLGALYLQFIVPHIQE